MTGLGALGVFAGLDKSARRLNLALGFAAGVMIAASFWSLLDPAIALSEAGPLPPWAPPLVGLLTGGIAVYGLDQVLPHLHVGAPREEAEGVPTEWRSATLFVMAVTLHNIPEGLSVGVAFGSVGAGGNGIAGATALAIGIGLQDVPEGLAVSAPLRRAGMSRRRAFFWGQLSGFVEVVFGLVGAVAVVYVRTLLPYALAFAAGAMLYVTLEEVIPEAHRTGDVDPVTLAALGGFALMMVLDVAL